MNRGRAWTRPVKCGALALTLLGPLVVPISAPAQSPLHAEAANRLARGEVPGNRLQWPTHTTTYDPVTREAYTAYAGSDGSLEVYGSNTHTGLTWSARLESNGDAWGTDQQSNAWTLQASRRTPPQRVEELAPRR
jgi:hypothetical protein